MARDQGQTDSGAEKQQERLRELGQVSGELLHDLGGILAVLTGRISLAREEAALGRLPSDELARIQGDAEELRRLVVEILDHLAGRRSPLEVTFPVQATLEEAVNRWLAGAPSVNTTLDSSLVGDLEIAGPRSFFSRAVGNLLRNAARHARREIRISVQRAREGSAVEILIEDDGDGIPHALRDSLFQPFVSQAERGMGLGLSFARWGVQRLGGSLEAQAETSTLGGASFRLLLPASTVGGRVSGSPATPPPVRSSRITPLEHIRVAVIDDDGAVRRTFARLLRRSGADCFEMDPACWASASHPVRELRRLKPDCILLDLNLLGFSGLEIHSLLLEQAPELAEGVIFFTGGASPPEALHRPVLNKLVGWDELITCIIRVTGTRRGRG